MQGKDLGPKLTMVKKTTPQRNPASTTTAEVIVKAIVKVAKDVPVHTGNPGAAARLANQTKLVTKYPNVVALKRVLLKNTERNPLRNPAGEVAGAANKLNKY